MVSGDGFTGACVCGWLLKWHGYWCSILLFWQQIHNVSGGSQHWRFRNSNLKQFWDARDDRCFFTCQYSAHKRSKKISDHNKRHGENKIPIKCPVLGCGSFETWEEYRLHIGQTHKCQDEPTRFKRYNPPSICKMTFTTPWSWLRRVEAEVEVCCEQCTKKFPYARQLRLH